MIRRALLVSMTSALVACATQSPPPSSIAATAPTAAPVSVPLAAPLLAPIPQPPERPVAP
jgi:ABC-type Fe3+-hydroxamate transport system substrate-binding protein